MRDEGGTAAWVDASAWRTITLVVMALLGALTLAGLIATLQGADRQRDEALRAQAHSYDVMILARSLAGTIARSEASLGRYVISADQQQGQRFYDQWTRAVSELDRLDAMTRDDTGQQARIAILRRGFAARGEELTLTALSTRYRRNRQAFARFYQARSAPSLATITDQLSGIIRQERALLDRRSADATASVAQSSRIAGGLAVFGILLVLGAIGLGWLTVRTIGERAIAESEAEAAHARAGELARAVADATAELRVQEAKLRQVQKMEAVGQLTGGIAHDFNNMLAVVVGGLELARRHVATDPAAAARHVDTAREGADRAAALTRRLLAFSREDSLKPEPIEASALMAGMTDLLDRTLGDAVTLSVRDEGGGWRVHADRVQLENAILNLAVNARDAMDGRGVLTIAIRQARLDPEEAERRAAGDYVALAVTDTGAGMAPEVAERVFEPFFTTKEAGRGTGLGLSQVFALVDQLGGWIAIDTAPGRGTTVTLHLPRHLTDEAAGDIATVDEFAGPSGSLRVLLVEDDPRVLAATSAALGELGHRVTATGDPLTAPQLLDRSGPFDLLMTDVLMPRRTGPEMIAALGPAHAGLPVLFVTGFAGETAAADIEGRPVLRKPFTLIALERAVAAATAGAPHPDQLAAE